jgi:hypothetical protein
MFANVAGGDKRVAGSEAARDRDSLQNWIGTAPSSTNAIRPADPVSFS